MDPNLFKMNKTSVLGFLLHFYYYYYYYYFFFFFFCLLSPCLTVFSTSSNTTNNSNSMQEGEILLELLKGMQFNQNSCIGFTWENYGSSCPSSFCGVTCSDEGFVIGLDLSNQSLQGTIKPNILSKLTKLSSLDLSANLLSGQLPQDIGEITTLQRLDLSSNLLSGPLPSSISTLKTLLYINISSNLISGSIPNDLSQLKSLQTLDLHGNLLGGEIDPSLLGLSSLSTVDLSSNKLQGFIPWQPNDTLPVLRTVEYVNLSHNLLTGPLAPPKFSSVFAERLKVLDMSYNQLSGDLPDFEFVIALTTLRLNENLFTGSVPSTLLSATLGLLEELDLSKNNLSGNVDRISSTSLKYLNLSFNTLSGELPKKLGSCSIVDLSHNNFNGDLAVLSYWTDMLEILDLSSNKLTGQLTEDIYMFVRLRNLNLSNNGLSGSIPSNYGFLPKIGSIDLSFNQLNGNIPRSLLNSSTLSYLLLSNNELIGNIPLQGAIATAFSPRIVTIDLSNNKLDGDISEGISRFQMLKDLDLSNNHLLGHIPESLSNLTLLQSLDLSNNGLSGSIPLSLPNTLTQLQLSNNKLSGQIPTNLERFPNSSFYPGNEELHYLWPLSVTNKGEPLTAPFNVHHRTFSIELKAGLIAGSIATFTLLLIVIFLIYYKCLSKHDKMVGSGNGRRDIPKGHNMWSPCATYLDNSHQRSSSIKNSSADLLLDRPSETSKGSERTREIKHESSKQKGRLEMSPLTVYSKHSLPANFHSSPRMGDELISSPVILKVQSPDKLAGDLHFLDKSLIFTAEDLSRAPAEVLGRSSHGTSYKATLDNGHALTVKWLREGLAKSKKEFGREANKFAKIKHPNLIPLRGYYWGPREHEKLILSDFVRAGSLAAHIADRAGQRYTPLSWQQRLVIAVDIARGLSYLHDERHLSHGNLKATNVLIDTPNLNAKLADYGLHELMTSEGTSNQILNAGALGYRAPELASTKRPRPSFKGDLYAFGVLVLELLTGQGAGDIISGQSGAVDLTDWVRLLANEGRAYDCFDPMLVGGGKSNEKLLDSMEETLNLALKCISPQPSERPSIRSVYEELMAISA